MTITIEAPPWRSASMSAAFTDLVVADSEERTEVSVPSVPADPGEGVITLTTACEALGQLMENSSATSLLHGSTVATNTLLEGKGATVGLLTTAGFRDSLEARRGLRKDPWDHRTPYPPVLVPRYLRQPVCGRIDARGNEVEPVNLDDVRAACKVFRDEGVESIAVCLLNSFVNTAHEDAVADVLREEHVCDWISVSSDIVPIMERRTDVDHGGERLRHAPGRVYLTALQQKLIDLGLKTKLRMLQSNGGRVA